MVNSFIEKDYLTNLTEYRIKPPPQEVECITTNNIRLLKLDRIVYDKNEDNLDKLNTIYNTIGNFASSIFLLLNSSNGTRTDVYLGIRTAYNSHSHHVPIDSLKKGLQGNFPGTEFTNQLKPKIEDVINSIVYREENDTGKFISSISGIPALKDEEKETFVQGLEKLIDTMKGEPFSALFIADPLSTRQLQEIKEGYERLYSQLLPFVELELNFGINESETVSKSLTDGFTETVSQSLARTQSHTISDSLSKTDSDTKGTSHTITNQLGGNIYGGIFGLGLGGGGGLSYSRSTAKGTSETHTDSTTKTRGTSEAKGISDTIGTSTAKSFQLGISEGKTSGSSQNIQIKFEDKKIKNLLEKIDRQLQRIRESEDFGMWNCAAYFLSDDKATSTVAANTFKALLRGKDSSLENSFVNTWDESNGENYDNLLKYLQKIHHPLFDINIEGLPPVTPGSLISGKELALHCGLPKKSINGLPVLECAEFGRNVITYDTGNSREKIYLGEVYHMGRTEKKTELNLDMESLNLHAFITGSTGSGKSNTVYQILSETMKKNIKFLVIEPAKGEYKSVFGGQRNVSVYGTNPEYTELLRINPFKFPGDIHVLEHIDRLIEIFNACWPMYAAMPAVLKESIERAYELAGWDLEQSINIKTFQEYPDFRDLFKALKMVIGKSAYSQEVKSNYTGALVTRVKSLTNGLSGQMLTSNELSNKELFDESCIIDLSRIGSIETKSLIMGFLFIKLQEYRMSSKDRLNSNLKHITILEEAHHLLRRTSFEQSQESSNLQGKSVEMIANAIAEMRAYGEGFIIVDQSPGLLDMSVIRNTNTKIILRLPEESDRHTAGKSANLNEDQILEISKLRTGVAAVYQNNWMIPVLCQVKEYTERTPYVYKADLKKKYELERQMKGKLIKLLLKGRSSGAKEVRPDNINIDELKEWARKIYIKPDIHFTLLADLDKFKKENRMILWKQENFEKLSKIISSLVDIEKLLILVREEKNFYQWNKKFISLLYHYIELSHSLEIEIGIIQCLLHNFARQEKGCEELYFSWVEYARTERWDIL